MVCVTHPAVDATLVCTRCGRWHCDACARPLLDAADRGGPRGCCRCDGLLKVAEVRREPDTLVQLLRRPLNSEGAMTLGALAVPTLAVWFGGFIGAFCLLLYAGLLAGYYYQTVEHVARGEEGLPFSVEAMTWDDIAGRLLRGVASLFIAVLPALLWRSFVGEPLAAQVLLLALGIACVPVSILAGVIGRSFWNVVWPPLWWQIVRVAPRSYARLLGVFLAAAVVWGVSLALLLALLPLPVAMLANNLFAVWQASLLGGFLQREAENLGLHY